MPRNVMDGTTVGNKMAALRAEDAVVRERLADLDAKLGQWLEAMEAADAVVRSGGVVVGGGESGRPAARRRLTDAARSQPGGQAPPDGEALLKSLDADTANAIRVKRRLSNEKREVHDLLEELRAMQKKPGQSGGDKKRWWRRKDE